MTAREIADRYWQQAPKSEVTRKLHGQRVTVTRLELAEDLAQRYGVSVEELHRCIAEDLQQ